jgi:hypothetical protein
LQPFRSPRLSRLTAHWPLLLALAIAALAAWPLLAQPGLLNTRGGGDSPFLLQRLHQLETALLDGHFPVRWMPDANYGYGYPFYNFYAPLSLYITAVFRLLGFSFVRAIQLSQLLAFLVAAAGMYGLARRWFGSRLAGLVTAVAYTVAPFHMVNVYVRGDSLAEFWAMAWFPWVIWAADRALSAPTQRGRRAAWLALAYAALILSHNISALIFFAVFVVVGRGASLQVCKFASLQVCKFAGLQVCRFAGGEGANGRGDGFASLQVCKFAGGWGALWAAGGLALGVALAAWFFVPALLEQGEAQLGPVTAGYFFYGNHFRGADLVQTSFRFDYDVSDGRAFRMGLIQAILAVAGLLALLFPPRPLAPRPLAPSPPTAPFILLALIIATFMITPLSRPLWDHLPLLPFTQFPWRFLSVQAFAAALATGGLALLPWRRARPWASGLALLLLLLSGLGALRTDHLILTDADVTAEKLAQYEWFTGNIGGTVSAEYLPPAAQPRPYTSAWLNTGQRQRVQAVAGDLRAAQLVDWRTDRQSWRVATAAGAALVFPTLYWPGWRAEVNGAPAALRPAPGAGLIMLDLPPGAHSVTLRLARTPLRLAAELLSLAALLLLLWLLRPRGRPSIAWRPLAGALALAVALAVGLRLGPPRSLPPDDLTWDFAQMGYLHHAVDGVRFENGALLVGYAYGDAAATAGEPLTITLHVANGAGRRATLALTTPAVAWPAFDPAPPLIAAQTAVLTADVVTFTLPIPANAPAGLVTPRLTLADARPLMPSGAPRGDLFLRPLRLQPAAGAPPSPHPLDARGVRATPRDAETLDVQLAWWTERPLTHRYNFSLRLLDGSGAVRAQLDGQPGYGFQPSSGWPAGEWVHDWLALGLPPGAAAHAPLALVVYLYDVTTGELALARRLGELDGNLDFAAQTARLASPGELGPATAVFTAAGAPLIALHAAELDQGNGRLTLTWRALDAIPADYTRFVHVVDPATGAIVAQMDGYPLGDSYPTSQWAPGETVRDVVVLDLAGAPPGDYQLFSGFYRRIGADWVRLTAVAPDGVPFPDDRVLLPETLKVD